MLSANSFYAHTTAPSVNQTTPAIVAQSAVRTLPRWALLLFCAAYILPGFFGRSPWKNADVSAFGYMLEIAAGRTEWLRPRLVGLLPETDGMLPYWLGALMVKTVPSWFPVELATRLPFIGLLALTLACTWCGVYYLARSHGAQPVAFAFGGEAEPVAYATAVADGGLLALIATLGLAQLTHEGTAYSTQLACTTLVFFALAAAPYRRWLSGMALLTGLLGLAASGAPTLAALYAIGGVVLSLTHPTAERSKHLPTLWWLAWLVAATLAAAALAGWLDAWRWRVKLPHSDARDWGNFARLLLWFAWPTWLLAVLALWRWRRQLAQWKSNRHLTLPLWFVLVAVATTLLTHPADRALLLALPALATLAAFALPTLSRSLGALIDWFTLLFFTGAAITVWVVWISMQTGFPRQPAANVARLAPEFLPSFSLLAFAVALAATLAWGWLVWWRAGRHRSAIWKSLVLPAGGAALGWMLLMTLWLPALDFARSYAAQTRAIVAVVGQPACVEEYGLDRGQMAGFQYHGNLRLKPATQQAQCDWLLVDQGAQISVAQAINTKQWTQVASINRPADRNDLVLVYQRVEQVAGRPPGP